MAVSSNNSAPYAPSSAIIDVIDRYRNRGLSKPFTADVLGRAGVSGSLVPRTLQALQILDLIGEDGNPTETLESLRRASEADFKPQMAAWLRAAYADVFSYVEPTDDETAIRDAFRAYNPVGQQPRMVALFIGLCRTAGLRPEDPTKESRPRPAARKTALTTAKREKTMSGPVTATRAEVGLPSALAGLLECLPSSRKWTQAQRDKFVTTFSTVLDFCIEVTDDVTDPEEVDQ